MGFSPSVFLVVLFPFKQVSGFSVCFLRRVFGSTENRHSLQEFLVFASKNWRGRTGLEEGGSVPWTAGEIWETSLCPLRVHWADSAPQDRNGRPWAWGPSSPEAPVPYPWHRGLIKRPGQKKARVFNGDLCGQMTEEWRSPVLCSVWNPGEFIHTWGRSTRMTEGEKKQWGWIFYWPWCVGESGENEIQSFSHTWFWGPRWVYTILVI